jgi:hypothetical protein
MTRSKEEIREKLQIALDMFSLGTSIMRQKLRRSHPSVSDPELESKVEAWLAKRPGAEHGDTAGRVRRTRS